jgi:hypothetical protein
LTPHTLLPANTGLDELGQQRLSLLIHQPILVLVLPTRSLPPRRSQRPIRELFDAEDKFRCCFRWDFRTVFFDILALPFSPFGARARCTRRRQLTNQVGSFNQTGVEELDPSSVFADLSRQLSAPRVLAHENSQASLASCTCGRTSKRPGTANMPVA